MVKNIRNIQISFSESHITHFGGLFLINSFCKKLCLKKHLKTKLKLHQRNNDYHTADFILVLLYTIILGIKRIENTRFLQTNGIFKKIVGLERFPNPTAIRRFLYRLSPRAIRQIVQVHNLIQGNVFKRLHTKTSITLDIDGTVLTVFGKQQRTKVGYNPKRRGARSYLAMLCFESDREFWYGSLYHGSASQVKIAKHVVRRCIAKLPYPIYRIRLRADAAFYSIEFIEDFLEDENIGYTIDAQLQNRPSLIHQMEQATYTPYRNWEVAEFMRQTRHWKRPHRFVVQRRQLPNDLDEKMQLKLFEIKNYGYRVLVTNLPLQPGRIWDFYTQRAQGAELNIKELKQNYSLAQIPTKNFTANVAYLQLQLFAFNIINWFKWLCLPEDYYYAALHTIREQLLLVPARLTRTNNKNVLSYPAAYQYQYLLHAAIRNIKKLKEL